MRVYLDNCCYNRPYDDQSQLRISLETQAKLHIQELISSKKLELAASYVLFAENDANHSKAKRDSIRQFVENSAVAFVDILHRDKIRELSLPIMQAGIKYADACHVACAIFSHCDYFISTDKRLLRFQTNEIKMRNPLEFITEVED